MTLTREGLPHRAPRPLIMCAAAAAVLACVAFFVMVAVLLLQGLERWAHGQPIDFMGFAAVLGAMGTLLGAIGAIAGPIFNARYHTQIAQIQQGQGVAPFSPSGGVAEPPMINPHGGPDAP